MMLSEIVAAITVFVIGFIIAIPIGMWIHKRKEKKHIKKLKEQEVEIRTQIAIEEKVQKEVEDAKEERRSGAGGRGRDRETERRRRLSTGKPEINSGDNNIPSEGVVREEEGVSIPEDSTDGTTDIRVPEIEPNPERSGEGDELNLPSFE